MQQNAIMNRKFNFYSENILSTRSLLSGDYLYSAGINGLITRLAKKDLCRILTRHKEKIKNIHPTKVLSFASSDFGATIKIDTYTASSEQ